MNPEKFKILIDQFERKLPRYEKAKTKISSLLGDLIIVLLSKNFIKGQKIVRKGISIWLLGYVLASRGKGGEKIVN